MKSDWTQWIVSDVNVSISDPNKHYSGDEIVKIFSKNPENINTPRELYVLDTIFTESYLEALYNFLQENRIGFDQAKALYLLVKKRGKSNAKMDWFFGV